MKRKRNGFLTFCFSFLPGAGHMFIGFFKEGVSLMSAFFGLICLTSWLEIEPIIFLIPVIWFYSFFDAMNKNSLSDSDFEQLEDHYLFVNGLDEFKGFSFSRYRAAAAVLIILFGISLLCNNMVDLLATFGFTFSYEAHQIFFRYIPQMVIAVLIIAAGIYLIVGKRDTLEQDLSEEESLLDRGDSDGTEYSEDSDETEYSEDSDRTEGGGY